MQRARARDAAKRYIAPEPTVPTTSPLFQFRPTKTVLHTTACVVTLTTVCVVLFPQAPRRIIEKTRGKRWKARVITRLFGPAWPTRGRPGAAQFGGWVKWGRGPIYRPGPPKIATRPDGPQPRAGPLATLCTVPYLSFFYFIYSTFSLHYQSHCYPFSLL